VAAKDVERSIQQHPHCSGQGLRHHHQHPCASATRLPSLTRDAWFRLLPISRELVCRSSGRPRRRVGNPQTTETLQDNPSLGIAVLIIGGITKTHGLGIFFLLSQTRTTNKKRKDNYAKRHEHGLCCGKIISLGRVWAPRLDLSKQNKD
jgi:hypothetical protein